MPPRPHPRTAPFCIAGLPLIRAVILTGWLAGCSGLTGGQMPPHNPAGAITPAVVLSVIGVREMALPVGTEIISRLKADGLSETLPAEGRLVLAGCGVGPGLISHSTVWKSLVVLPPGQTAQQNDILNLAVTDGGDDVSGRGPGGLLRLNYSTGPNEQISPPGLFPAYDIDHHWKEKGLSTNIRWITLPAGRRDVFTVVGGNFFVSCNVRQGASQ